MGVYDTLPNYVKILLHNLWRCFCKTGVIGILVSSVQGFTVEDRGGDFLKVTKGGNFLKVTRGGVLESYKDVNVSMPSSSSSWQAELALISINPATPPPPPRESLFGS